MIGKSLVWILKLIFRLLRWTVLLALPFMVLIRGSVWMYSDYHLGSWPALGVGMATAFVVLMVYMTMMYGLLFGFKKLSKRSLRIKAFFTVALLAVYCGFMVFSFQSKNAKTDKVKKEFRSLHPLLRVATGTIVLIDRSMLVTDMSRTQKDYKRMGLKSLKNSLHYKQKDGYVHALDLRTKSRAEWRNWLMKAYFEVMGFNTLRHVGTADHLHISLSVRGSRAI